MTTAAPSAARPSATARPIPLPAPVTSATFCSSRPMPTPLFRLALPVRPPPHDTPRASAGIIVPRRRASASGDPVLEVRVLLDDLVAGKREDVAAVDLDLLALGRGAAEHPLREATVARDEVARLAEVRVGEHLEHAREGLAHALAAFVARPTHRLAGGRLEDTVVGHERHDVVDVVAVPALTERFQIFHRHHVPASLLT